MGPDRPEDGRSTARRADLGEPGQPRVQAHRSRFARPPFLSTAGGAALGAGGAASVYPLVRAAAPDLPSPIDDESACGIATPLQRGGPPGGHPRTGG